MSRIYVKNIGKSTTDKQLKELFSSKGEVTDVKIICAKDGKSRRFAFVGFRTDQQAQESQQYFNNTFLGLSKISVDIAKKANDKSLKPKRGSSHSDTVVVRKIEPESAVVDGEGEGEGAKAAGPNVGKKKNEFLDMMKGRKKPNKWADTDDIKEEDAGSDSEVEDEEEDEEDEEESEEEGDAVPRISPESQPMSDLEYMRSKGKRVAEEKSGEVKESGAGASGTAAAAGEGAEDEDIDASRIIVKNIPYSCTEAEFRAVFEGFGAIQEVHIPLDGERRGRGYGFVQFLLPEEASTAIDAIEGESFQGRVLHISTAKRAAEYATSEKGFSRLSSFQQKKEEERRRLSNKTEGWNASYLRGDAVVDALASRHGVSAADILDTSQSGGDIALRMAIGETQIVAENKQYFALHGVDIDTLESALSQSRAGQRSTTTLLVKNLPPDSIADELESMFARFGRIQSFLVPPSKTVAIVVFVEPTEARAAQKGLAYRNYKHTPLYLEWAPESVKVKTGTGVGAGKEAKEVEKGKVEQKEKKEKKEKEEEAEEYATLFVKNLNFSTSEDNLADHLKRLSVEGVRTVLIQKKQIGKHMLSQGYGFVEFRGQAMASAALAKMQGSLLDSHALEVKPAEKRISSRPEGAKVAEKEGKESNKLIVRNVAFQASKTEIRDLFAVYGAVKRVRIPKKMGGEHRGFAFVDFSTSQEAAQAMAALKNTHLYGRHLVLEWADEESDAGAGLGSKGVSGAGSGMVMGMSMGMGAGEAKPPAKRAAPELSLADQKWAAKKQKKSGVLG
ncbi:hypothetical protein B484DRAFT_452942 [Ochromonadaceae sp. CCMP2298]|nr:hypothetical protein B484DRAFT_452942 [Ochromonadaceae sp. CCMP2298]